MIYGCLWDATLQWLADSGISVGYSENNGEFGNYASNCVLVSNGATTVNIKLVGTYVSGPGFWSGGRVLKTGQSSYTRRNNIYDLSGNYHDWTQEACDTNQRISRGRLLQ